MRKSQVIETVTRIGSGVLRCSECEWRVWTSDIVTAYITKQLTVYPFTEYLQVKTMEERCCPDCHARLVGGATQAIWTPTQVCNDSCRNAISKTCRCSCMGLAHGVGWRR
jgi:hypothetical protein